MSTLKYLERDLHIISRAHTLVKGKDDTLCRVHLPTLRPGNIDLLPEDEKLPGDVLDRIHEHEAWSEDVKTDESAQESH